MNTLKYAIIGTGAIGGYYGGLLARSGRDVSFLLHRDYDYVKKHGLQIDSCDGSYHLANIKTYNTTNDMPQCDVILVGLKTTVNNQLPTLLRPLLKADTLVVLIQNGIGVEEDLQHEIPEAQLACGIAYVCTTKTGPGTVCHEANGRLVIGNYSIRRQESLDLLVADMQEAGVKVQAADYLETRWKKAVWNMPFNGMTVAMETDSVSLVSNTDMNLLIRRMMLEVVEAAKACGAVGVDESYVDRMMEMTRHMPPYSSSMKVDYDRHHPLETYYLYERPRAEAKKHGVEMPLMGMLEAMLKFKEARQLLADSRLL